MNIERGHKAENRSLAWILDRLNNKNQNALIAIVGPTGAGKCLPSGTPITMADGSQRPIEHVNVGESVLSLNDSLEIVPTTVSHCTSRDESKLIKLTFRSGREITLTREHPLLQLEGWVDASTLKPKERIACPRVTTFGTKSIGVHKGKILGYLTGDGCLLQRKISFTNKDPLLVSDFMDAVHDFDENLEVSQRHPYHYPVRSRNGRVGENTLINWLKDLGLMGKKSVEKFVPKCVFTAPKEEVRAYLMALFACDGHQSTNRHQFEYYTSSHILARQVHSLLLKFGAVSTVGLKRGPGDYRSWRVRLSGNAYRTFFGGAIENPNPNFDTIPRGVWTQVKMSMANRGLTADSIGTLLGSPPKHFQIERTLVDGTIVIDNRTRYNGWLSEHRAPSRDKLLEIANIMNDDSLKSIATSDIYWDEVVDVEEIHEPTIVYDLTLESNHNFIANDIIVHNSYAGMRLCQEVMKRQGREWDVDKYCFFRATEFFENIKTEDQGGYLQHGDALLADEWQLTAYNRNFMSAINRAVVEITSTFRRDNLCVVMTLPLLGMMDKHVKQMLHAYILMLQQGIGRWYYLKTDPFSGEIRRMRMREMVEGVGMQSYEAITFKLPKEKTCERYEVRKNEIVEEVKDAALLISQRAEASIEGKLKALDIVELVGIDPALQKLFQDGMKPPVLKDVMYLRLQKMWPHRPLTKQEVSAAVNAVLFDPDLEGIIPDPDKK